MFLFNRKRAFYRGNAIIYSLLFLCLLAGLLAIWQVDGLMINFYIYLFFVIVLFFGLIYYLINLVYDNQIRKKGEKTTAKIVKIYDAKSKGFSIGTIIILEYKTQDGKTIRTKESISRKFPHFFKKNERVEIKTNGKKGLLIRENFRKN